MIMDLANAVNIFFGILHIMLFVRIILSWIPVARDSRFMEILYSFTEPILAPIRNLIARSPLGGPGMVLDFSPLIALLLIRLAQTVIVDFLRGL